MLRKVYGVTLPNGKGKADHVKCLAKEIRNDGGAKLQSYYSSLPVEASADNGGDVSNVGDGQEALEEDDIDYGEEYYGKRVAKCHVEDKDRLCFGTVERSGFPAYAPETMHWNVVFDEDDAAVYGPNDRGNMENLNYNELMDALELYEEMDDHDVKKPSGN